MINISPAAIFMAYIHSDNNPIVIMVRRGRLRQKATCSLFQGGVQVVCLADGASA